MANSVKQVCIAFVLGAFVAACAPPPEKQPDPTVAQVNVTAAVDANPDPNGRASPAVVFLYALQPGSPFPTANPDALLGGELGDLAESTKRIARIVLVPGKGTKKPFELPAGTTDVGIAVAFRDFDTAQWRAMAPVKPNEVTLLKAEVGSNSVTIQ